MREIKFRGLSANGEWRYGDLSNDIKNSTAYYNEFSQRICWEYSNQPVKNGTVGQYTGLKDENGTEIYEGDLFISWGGKIFVIVWLDYKAGLYAVDYNEWETYRNGGEAPIDVDWIDNIWDLKVIGNIYENPELLD